MPGLNRPASKRNRDPQALGGSHVGQHPLSRKSDYPVVGGVPVNVPHVYPCMPADNTSVKARNPGTQPAPSYKPGNPDMAGGY